MRKDLKINILIIFNILSFFLMIFTNFYSVLFKINSNSIKEVSNKYDSLIVPHFVTFSIWLIIYIFIAIFVINQLIYFFKKDSNRRWIVEKTGLLFTLSSILNSIWIIVWLYEMILLSVIIIVSLLIILNVLYEKLEIGKDDFEKNSLTVKAPVSFYLSWIYLATILNISSFLKSLNINFFNSFELFWTLFMILLILILGIIYLINRKDLFFVLVIIWGYIGLIIKYMEERQNDSNMLIKVVIFSTILLFLFSIINEIYLNNLKKKIKKNIDRKIN